MNMCNIAEIVQRQRTYFTEGHTLPLHARVEALRALKQAVVAHKRELLQALKRDLGKSETEAYMCEVGLLLANISYALKHIKSWTQPHKVSSTLSNFRSHSMVYPEPLGLCLIIAPWNYPVLLTLDPLIGALAAGNCALLKPSELSPATAEVVARMIMTTFPSEYVAVVEGGVEISQALLEERFDHIFYTGGETVGREVMSKAALHLTPVTLELGGKSPAVVDSTANLRIAARRIVFGKFLNCGQTCVAPDYVLVERCCHDELVQLLRDEIQKMLGKALSNPEYGKIINRRHFDRLSALIDPRKVFSGGGSSPERLQIEPTLLVGVTPDDAVMQEEIFGPLLPILAVDSMAEALSFVKSRPQPLALYLFTESAEVEKRFLQEVSFGGGCINDTIMHLATHNLPFGGVGNSGMGSYHGKYTFDTFTHYKSIVKRAVWPDLPLRYPPFLSWKERLIKLWLR